VLPKPKFKYPMFRQVALDSVLWFAYNKLRTTVLKYLDYGLLCFNNSQFLNIFFFCHDTNSVFFNTMAERNDLVHFTARSKAVRDCHENLQKFQPPSSQGPSLNDVMLMDDGGV
jgi:hypothetical protein